MGSLSTSLTFITRVFKGHYELNNIFVRSAEKKPRIMYTGSNYEPKIRRF